MNPTIELTYELIKFKILQTKNKIINWHKLNFKG